MSCSPLQQGEQTIPAVLDIVLEVTVPSRNHKYIAKDTVTIQSLLHYQLKCSLQGFPGGAVVENLPANAGDTGSSPGLGGSHMPRSN